MKSTSEYLLLYWAPHDGAGQASYSWGFKQQDSPPCPAHQPCLSHRWLPRSAFSDVCNAWTQDDPSSTLALKHIGL